VSDGRHELHGYCQQLVRLGFFGHAINSDITDEMWHCKTSIIEQMASRVSSQKSLI